MGNLDPVEFCGEIKHETTKAFLVFDGVDEVWIAKSQIQDRNQIGKGNEWEFTIPEWLAIEKGII